MTNKLNYLKIYREEPPKAAPCEDRVGSLPEVLRAFKRATGWTLQYQSRVGHTASNDLTWSAPVNPGVGVTPGQFRLEPPSAPTSGIPPIEPAAAQELAGALAGMFGELLRSRQALWQREAELAAGVPLVPHAEEEQHLAARLLAVLKGGAEALGCHAAALYLLDESTSELKLRSCWGLPSERYTDPARSLEGALADLEALLGHAVVLEDTTLLAHWNPPENFPSAACVPISSPTTILGTLWVFSNQKRDFTESQTNILEILAGRVAADLEREMLMRESVDGAQLKRQLQAAERLQRNQLPSISPLLDGWDLAGWTEPSATLGGDFYDWFCLPDGLLTIALGSTHDRGLAGALASTNVKTALRSHAPYQREADRLLRQMNLTLWTGSAGDQAASLFCGLVETATGRASFATAGMPSILLLDAQGWRSLTHPSPQLGEGPDTAFEPWGCELQPGQVLLILSEGFREAPDAAGRRLREADLAAPLLENLSRPAKDLASLVRDRLTAHAPPPLRGPRTVLVAKRTVP